MKITFSELKQFILVSLLVFIGLIIEIGWLFYGNTIPFLVVFGLWLHYSIWWLKNHTEFKTGVYVALLLSIFFASQLPLYFLLKPYAKILWIMESYVTHPTNTAALGIFTCCLFAISVFYLGCHYLYTLAKMWKPNLFMN